MQEVECYALPDNVVQPKEKVPARRLTGKTPLSKVVMKSLQGDNFRQVEEYFPEFKITPCRTQQKLNDGYTQNFDEQLIAIEKQWVRQQQDIAISHLACELLPENEDEETWSISYLESKIELKKA